MRRATLVALACTAFLTFSCGENTRRQPVKPLVTPADTPSTQLDSPDPHRDEAHRRLNDIIAQVNSGETTHFNEWLVYKLPGDSLRQWKDHYHWESPEERLEIEKTIASIEAITDSASAFEAVEYRSQHDPEGEWHTFTVEFRDENGVVLSRARFSMIRTGDEYKLGEIRPLPVN